ncbi:hypothetical protein L249_1970 [Ophiocordyceps polyrhachis-furcata BCC 54312]|uniref:FAD-binding PCMH-type domain-containing protein n=1 Tax=Ophiocordyceps polyrhachis-furcata BCC 54312 TaxID=1330021 RepID=A0A367LNM8_9HYPO|nr:hypothetical protein L249_1970 [Ophiocordyceps polyrhachis-furcata BCC 54312]
MKKIVTSLLTTSLLPFLTTCFLPPSRPPGPEADAEAVCWSLSSVHGNDKVEWTTKSQQSTAYVSATSDYWNVINAGKRPVCVFFPSSAADVSSAVRALMAYPAARFALRSGGHNSNPGFSSVDGGVLIAFAPGLCAVDLASDAGSVLVGAGCKWDQVYSRLQPLGRTVVGGRMGDVGVTGFILGGGLSYLSGQYGLGCDNVLAFECVLANGTIVMASQVKHPDLYFALRGGGNQFAIVTRMLLRTFVVGDRGLVWGGVRIYAGNQPAALFAAISNFTASNRDNKAAMIPTFTLVDAFGLIQHFPLGVFFFFYDGREAPPGVFDAFNAIPAIFSDTVTRPYLALTRQLLGGDFYKNLRVRLRVNAFPNMPGPAMESFLARHWDHVVSTTSAAAADDRMDLRVFSVVLQPIPRALAVASRAASPIPNPLGLDPNHGDRIWVQYDLAWANPACDRFCAVRLKEIVDGAKEIHRRGYAGIPPTNYRSGNLEYLSYNPLFMNEAMDDQPVLQSYGHETHMALKVFQQRYDPTGLLSTRQGGFKIGW